MVQRCGGPPLYSQRKGHPALPRRHAPFDCSQATAERYMWAAGGGAEVVWGCWSVPSAMHGCGRCTRLLLSGRQPVPKQAP